MKLHNIFLAILVVVLSYVVVQYKLWEQKWRVIVPVYLFSHVYLWWTRPIYPNEPIPWITASSRLKSGLIKDLHHSVNIDKIPNIVLIITDDLGLNDLSGASGVLTPNIDSIRDNGVAFTQAYAGHATCAPSRGALLTGRFPTRFGYEFTPAPKSLARILTVPTEAELFHPILHSHLINKLPSVSAMALTRNETMISEVLQKHGYNTYYIGKWDSGKDTPHTPTDRGYNESVSFPMGASLYQKEWHPDLVNGYGDKFDDFVRMALRFYVTHNNGPQIEPDKYMTDYLAEQASHLIRARPRSTQVDPFFLALAFNAAHNPYQAMRQDYEDPEVQKLPTHFERVYAAMVKALDRGVGQVLQALRDSGQYENTLVIFTNDNGGAHYTNLPHLNAPYRGWKATFFEGGIRVPLFMQWPARIRPQQDAPSTEHAEICRTYAQRSAHPGVRCGYRTIDDVVSHVDLFPSLVSLVHPHPQETSAHRLDGLNLFDLIRLHGGWIDDPGQPLSSTTALSKETQEHSQSRALYWRSGHYSALRVGDWKFQIALRPNKVWFYNLKEDPTEQRNLAAELGIANRAAMESVRDAYSIDSNATLAASTQPALLQQLLEVFAQYERVDTEQAPPSWPAACETPVTVDKIVSMKEELTDECIYWSN